MMLSKQYTFIYIVYSTFALSYIFYILNTVGSINALTVSFILGTVICGIFYFGNRAISYGYMMLLIGFFVIELVSKRLSGSTFMKFLLKYLVLYMTLT